MALFQTGTGYRDATKALTIKALQERQKQAAAQMTAASAAQDVNADPLSAVSHVLGTLGAGFQQNRADQREADARQQLAGIMAKIDPNTGPTQAQLAEMQTLDPEFANKQYESAMEERRKIADREDTQKFQSGESQAERDARVAEQQAGFTHQDTTAATLAGTNEAAAVSANTRADQDKIDAAKIAEHQGVLDAAMRTKKGELMAAVQAGTMTEAEAANEYKIALDKQKAEALSAAPSLMRDFTPEERKAAGVADGVIAQVNTKTGEKVVGNYPQQSAAQNAMDTTVAKDVQDWDAGGRITVTGNMDKVTQALKAIQPGMSTLGKTGEALGVGQTGPVSGVMPDVVQSFLNPDMLAARDSIRTAVQSSLRAVLGSQFTENEGQAMMDRAFSMGQRPEVNIQKAKDIMLELQQLADAKDAQSKYFHEHGGIMKDYVPTYDIEGAKRRIANMFSLEGDGGGAPASAPATTEESDEDFVKRVTGPQR